MQIEGLNGRQYRLYAFLKENCVGQENPIPRAELARRMNLLLDQRYEHYKPNGDGIQGDIRVIRVALSPYGKFICSSPKGYYIPRDESEKSNFLGARALGHLHTALSDGSISKKEVYAWLNRIDISIPLDRQMKLTFTATEKEEIDHFGVDRSEDPEFQLMTTEQLKRLCYDLGGEHIKMTRKQYISEIRRLR